MVWATAALIAMGGLFGGLNTMYAAFAARVRELGTLQTLGFPRRAIAVSFLQESLLATAAGGLAAAFVGGVCGCRLWKRCARRSVVRRICDDEVSRQLCRPSSDRPGSAGVVRWL
jgi:predicted lysophospholipase L1 biosynthesis ABC-type transport system permease subunit